jgi:hypothetical protein
MTRPWRDAWRFMWTTAGAVVWPVLAGPRTAAADQTPAALEEAPKPPAAPTAPAQPLTPGADEAALPTTSRLPPPVDNPFIQYGVAFTTEFVASSGNMCATTPATCILGSGGGVVLPRLGWRFPGSWYMGVAYEMTKQDASTLYRLPILSQARAEGRYYFMIGQVLTPYVGASGGIAWYGNEWAANTFGPGASASLGVEAQVSRGTVVGLTFNYRAIYFKPFVDSSNTAHEGSVAQLLGLELQLEVRDPVKLER